MTRLLMTLIAVLTLLGNVSASEVSANYRAGAWDTVVQAMRKSDGVSLSDMDASLAGGGSAHVRYSMKNSNGPLVLILSGTFGRADNPYSDDLARELTGLNCNVITMDSFFSTRYITQTRQGAPGNLRREALVAANVIQEVLKRTGAKTTDISVVGVSYGGGVALQMAALEKEGKLPVKLQHVVAFSVPVSFRDAMARLDQFEDLPYSYDTIVPIVKSAKPGSSAPSGVKVAELEKVLGRGFRLDLSPAVDLVDRMYSGQIHPSPAKVLNLESLSNNHADKMDREVEAGGINFQALFSYWIAPYWIGKGDVRSEDELANLGEVALLLPNLDKKVELVLARNDPLNAPGTVEQLEKIQTSAHLTVLPDGGHAAYVRMDQGRSILHRIFSQTVAKE